MNVGAIADPFRGEAPEDTGDNRFRADIGPGVWETFGFGPPCIGGESGQQIAAGRLIQLLKDWSLPSGDIHTVYPAARFRPRKVTAFVEMLIAAE
ncbi:hypothetical protein X732_29545 [Mesorhizobium sp. L2C066B000]|nr:hypothetical protein X732_29545 [Mesorhizobium sp. L2C066B000]